MQCASLFRYEAPASQATGVSRSASLSSAHMPRLQPASGRVRLAPPSAGARPLETRTVGSSTNIRWHKASVAREDKERLLSQRGCVLWFTGLSASGKSTVATETERQLHERGHLTLLLDGDNVRHGLNCNLGFSAEDRTENIRRVGEVAKLVAESGVMALTSFISPYREDRDAVRERVGSGSFLEVFLAVPIELCEERDPKGLYKKARAGQIQNFTGVDDPYEAPRKPEITLTPYRADGTMHTPEEMAGKVISFLEDAGYIARPPARRGSQLSQPAVA